MKTNYIFHSDPGHAWLAVKKAELKRLKIDFMISSFSYMNGETAYLEEDRDAEVFLNAKKAKGEMVNIKDSYREHTPIRNYENYWIERDECVVDSNGCLIDNDGDAEIN